MPAAFKTLILALLITFSFLAVSKFSVASDLSNLSDDEVCDGYFAKVTFKEHKFPNTPKSWRCDAKKGI